MVINSTIEFAIMFRLDSSFLQKCRPVLIFLLFLALALVMTYPLLFNLDRGVRDPGDPFLNSWILAWDVKKIASLDWKDFFDANIFYPCHRTLAFSEFLFTQALVALPVLLISGNPILAHNIVLLLAFITSGFGMYLLASSLTKNTGAGIVAGIIYAFSPFMFAHLSHLQVLSAGGIPLTFLFLHRYFATSSSRDFFLFTLFYILQVLANGYYALYLTVFAGLFIFYHTFSRKKYADPRFWLKMGAFILLVALTVGPFFYQYIKVRAEFDFTREIGFSAKLVNFLATAKINRIYGRLTQFAWSPEGELFPGATAFLLALTGLFLGLRIRREKGGFGRSPKAQKILSQLKILLNCLIFLWLALVISIILLRGFQISIGGLQILSAHHLLNPLLSLAGLLILRVLIARLPKLRVPKFTVQGDKNLSIYAGMLILAFLFTFGLDGPYYFLYKYFPGFDGLRVTSRFQIFVMFSLAVLAAFSVSAVWKRLKGRGKPVFVAAVSLLILAENFSLPIPLTRVPVKEEIPEVYRWLGSQKGEDFALLELPLPQPTQSFCVLDCPRLYFSTFHWKSLVNGFSGYASPVYEELTRRWQKNSLEQNIEDLRVLRLRYLLIHSSECKDQNIEEIIQRLNAFEPSLRFFGQFEDVYVFEFSAPAILGKGGKLPGSLQFFSLRGSAVRTNVNMDQAGAAVDGSIESRWESGPQERGQYFQVDLGSIEAVEGISLSLGKYAEDYPRGYAIEVSPDGVVWQEVARQDNCRLPLTAYLRPRFLPLEITFPRVEARYLKVTNLGEDPMFSWSICEFDVLK
jgi:hypothetical protein